MNPLTMIKRIALLIFDGFTWVLLLLLAIGLWPLWLALLAHSAWRRMELYAVYDGDEEARKKADWHRT